MTITLQLQQNTVGDDLQRLVDRISRPGSRQTRSIADAIRAGFQDNFTSAGAASGQAWPRLAPSTVSQRRREGFAGSNPILVRTGGLRDSYVNRGGANHYESVRQQGGYTIIEAGSEHPNALFHERGTARMPRRSVSLLGDQSENRIANVVEFVLGQLANEVLR